MAAIHLGQGLRKLALLEQGDAEVAVGLGGAAYQVDDIPEFRLRLSIPTQVGAQYYAFVVLDDRYVRTLVSKSL
jgi:hypothetical protein